jgi:hypothetical protein
VFGVFEQAIFKRADIKFSLKVGRKGFGGHFLSYQLGSANWVMVAVKAAQNGL